MRQTKALLTLKAQHKSLSGRFYLVSPGCRKDELNASFALCFPPAVTFGKYTFIARKEKFGTIWVKIGKEHH